jgi:hypothetical protein
MLTSHRVENGLQVITEADTPDSDALIQVFDEASEVCSCEMLRDDQQGVLVQFVVIDRAIRCY